MDGRVKWGKGILQIGELASAQDLWQDLAPPASPSGRKQTHMHTVQASDSSAGHGWQGLCKLQPRFHKRRTEASVPLWGWEAALPGVMC